MNKKKTTENIDEPKLYNIYVILNNANRIKIGITTDFETRLQSLSGSNGGGNRIVRYYVSPQTYLYSLETTMHNIYSKYRIKGTEWFEGDDLYFQDVKDKLKELFNSEDYKLCNELRKQLVEKHKNI